MFADKKDKEFKIAHKAVARYAAFIAVTSTEPGINNLDFLGVCKQIVGSPEFRVLAEDNYNRWDNQLDKDKL